MILNSPTISGSLVVTGNLITSGSLTMSGSQTITGSLTVSSSNATQLQVGSNLLFVSSSGNVGLGTTSPRERFDVVGLNGNIRIWGRQSIGDNQITSNVYYDGSSWVRDNASYGATSIVFDSTNAQLRFYTTSATSGYPTERMRVSADGNVGIGTTNPTARLHVSGTTGGVFEVDGAAAVNALYVSASGNVGIGTTNPTTRLEVYDANNAAYIGITAVSATKEATLTYTNALGVAYIGLAGGAGNIITGTSAGDLNINNRTTGRINLSTNNTAAQVSISGSSGNVGIGKTNPSTKLDVNGNTTISGSLTVTGSITTPGTLTAQTLVVQTITSSVDFVTGSTRFGSISSNTHQFTGSMSVTGGLVVSAGNVGIGTTSPNYLLHVNGGGASIDADGSYLYIRSSSGRDSWGINNTHVSALVSDLTFTWGDGLTTPATEIMRLSGSGNVGIGTTVASARLHVSGTTGGVFEVDGAAAVNALYVSASGVIGIGTTLIPNALGNALQLGGATTFMSYVNNSYFLNNWYYDASGNARYIGAATSSGYIQDSFGNHKWFSNPSGTANTIFTPTERMIITSAGNVGIGTTNPTQKLHVNGFARVQGVSINKTGGTVSSFIGYENDWIGSGTSNDLAIASEGSNNIKFYTNGTADVRMIINTSGSVGISNTNPQAKLDLGTTAGGNYRNSFFFYNDNNSGPYHGTKNGFYMDQFSLSNNSTLAFSTATAAPGTFYVCSKDTDVNTSSSLTPRMVILGQSGNVGIGITNPSRKFQVMEAGTSTSGNVVAVRNDNSTAGAFINFIAGGANAPAIGAKGNDIVFTADGYSGTELMRISGSGNVGIGTTSPSVLLHAYKAGDYQLRLQNPNTGGGYWNIGQSDNAFNAGGSKLLFVPNSSDSNAATVVFTTGGNVGIGTTNPGTGTGGTGLQIHNTSTGAGLKISVGNFFSELQVGNDGTTYLFTTSSKHIVLQTPASSGNVGIGTTNPGTKLEVSGSIKVYNEGGYFGGNAVTVSVLNTDYVIFNAAHNGIIVIRDNTTGGTGCYLIDPNAGTATISSNVNGALTFTYSAGKWYIKKTSGTVPTNYTFAFVGA